MKLVIDASFAMLWLSSERDVKSVHEFDARFHAGQIEMHAPESFLLDATNVLTRLVRRRTRTLEESVAMFENVRELPIQLHRHSDLVVSAFDLSVRRGISTYDAAYVALAVREVLPLFTADKRLGAAVEDLVEVITA